MRLKKLLKNLDWGTDVRIWGQQKNGKWVTVYEGWMRKVNKKYLNYKLIKANDNKGSEAICPCIDDKGQAILRITLAGTDKNPPV